MIVKGGKCWHYPSGISSLLGGRNNRLGCVGEAPEIRYVHGIGVFL